MDLQFRFRLQSRYLRGVNDEVFVSNYLLRQKILSPCELALGLTCPRQGHKKEDSDLLDQTAQDLVLRLTDACLMEVGGWLEVLSDDWVVEDEEGRLEPLHCCFLLA